MTKARAKRKARPEAGSPFRLKWSWLLVLVGVFLFSLAPRLYGGLTFGRGLDGPGTFQLVNYDEGGSCRAVLGDFTYPTFLGRQIIAIAELIGRGPPPSAFGADRGKAYCQSWSLIAIARGYSAVAGALTVVLLGLVALMMWPGRPQIAWTACALLGFSNFHVAESHSGTADAPQVFFIYLLITVLVYGIASNKRWPLLLSPLFLIGAVWTKWYVFAVFAYASVLPMIDLRRRSVQIAVLLASVVTVSMLFIGWEQIAEVVTRRSGLLWGPETSRFGTGYGNIGTWRRWIRNSVNLPIVHIVGLGLPAILFVPRGIKRALQDRGNRSLWLAHVPALVYASYLLLLGPVTYYRYYLPLFPIVALLAAFGLWESRWAVRKPFLVLFLLYPMLLTLDSEYNYRNDPRRQLSAWYSERGDPSAYATFYVAPPRAARKTRLFSVDRYIKYDARYLAPVDYVLLSENWYDTSFPNELNGPIAWNPQWLIKTRPEYVVAYRNILSGQDPNLKLDTEINLRYFMPEFLVHRHLYGSFPLFIGDLKIYRVVRGRR